MNVKQFIRVLATVTAVLLMASYAVAQGRGGHGGGGKGPSYDIIAFDPPQLPNSSASSIGDLNATGQAVGQVIVAGVGYAVHLDVASETYTVLSDGRSAHGNNDNNQTVGDDYNEQPVYWETPDSITPPLALGLLPGDISGSPWDINNEGIAVGYSSPYFSRPVAWHVDGATVFGPIELPPLPDHEWGWAAAVSEGAGGNTFVVVGALSAIGGPGRAVQWTITLEQDGSLTSSLPEDLHTGTYPDAYTTHFRGVNDAGDAVGLVYPDGPPIWAPAGGSAESLPLPNNVYYGRADDINNAGDVVGRLWAKDGRDYRWHATLWRGNDVIYLQSYLPRGHGWTLTDARRITDGGLIGGVGRFDVRSRGFIMVPAQ